MRYDTSQSTFFALVVGTPQVLSVWDSAAAIFLFLRLLLARLNFQHIFLHFFLLLLPLLFLVLLSRDGGGNGGNDLLFESVLVMNKNWIDFNISAVVAHGVFMFQQMWNVWQ